MMTQRKDVTVKETADVVDLPFDPVTRDIVCRRDPDDAGALHFNIPQRHQHHSPTGFEFGYGGSGPADFALNILALFIPAPPDPGPMPDERTASAEDLEAWMDAAEQRVRLWDGSSVHVDAWDLHQRFKTQFVATLPRAGGTIPGAVIAAWIVAAKASAADETTA